MISGNARALEQVREVFAEDSSYGSVFVRYSAIPGSSSAAGSDQLQSCACSERIEIFIAFRAEKCQQWSRRFPNLLLVAMSGL